MRASTSAPTAFHSLLVGEIRQGAVQVRSTWRRLVVVLAAFSAVCAFGGGIALMIAPQGGGPYGPPLSLLENTPFPDFTVPGAILFVVVGGTSALAAILAARRSSFAVDAVCVAGGALTMWILAEAAMMRTVNALHVGFGALGVALLVAGVRGALSSSSIEPRHRWLVVVTAGETLGFCIPALIGAATALAHVEGTAQVLLLSAAGACEGLVLGAAQASSFPAVVSVDRARYAAFTAIGAAIAWLAAMSLSQALPAYTSSHVDANGALSPASVVVVALAAAAAAVTALVALAGAQWLELRKHNARARSFALITAIAWLVALPMSFLPMPFVDEDTPTASLLALWMCAGVLMAFTMAVVTWQGARRLTSIP